MDGLNIDNIIQSINESINVKRAIIADEAILDTILRATQCCIDAYKRGNRVLLAGNGGSAADSQHIAAELVSRFNFDRPGLPAISLTTDTSMLTAIGNDYGYKHLFRRQLEANGEKGDVFIGISTSGNSENIICALKETKKLGMKSIGLTGCDGGGMFELCDICIKVPSSSTPRIQEGHITIGHIICEAVELALFSGYKK